MSRYHTLKHTAHHCCHTDNCYNTPETTKLISTKSDLQLSSVTLILKNCWYSECYQARRCTLQNFSRSFCHQSAGQDKEEKHEILVIMLCYSQIRELTPPIHDVQYAWWNGNKNHVGCPNGGSASRIPYLERRIVCFKSALSYPMAVAGFHQ
jgi:hypothetical protein